MYSFAHYYNSELGSYYLDNASTRPPRRELFDELKELSERASMNPSRRSIHTRFINERIQMFRDEILEELTTFQGRILFNSGATEGINHFLKSICFQAPISRRRILTLPTEHLAVLETLKALSELGYVIEEIQMLENGLIDLENLKELISSDTCLVCAMHVNNETGVIQPIEEIGAITKAYEAKFFCDMTQSFGKIRLDVDKCNIDGVCASAHKLGGLVGVGFLWERTEGLEPLIHGGQQQGGGRAGTMNYLGIESFSIALRHSRNHEPPQDSELSKFLVDQGVRVEDFKTLIDNCDKSPWITPMYYEPGFVSFQANFPHILVSNGSACKSGLTNDSNVYTKLNWQAEKVIRFSF